MSWRTIGLIAAGAVIALAAWPSMITHYSVAPAAAFTPAPIVDDWRWRDKTIAFYERVMKARPDNHIFARTLALQYMERFRERGDIGDVTRADAMARRSLRLQPQGNIGADMALASALLTYHKFRQALHYVDDAVRAEPDNPSARAEKASIEMELGEYAAAHHILSAPPLGGGEDPTWDAVEARYDELTGHQAKARVLIARGTRIIDENFSNSAYSRSWFHMRCGQLAFEAGDDAMAESEFDRALKDYPDNPMALAFQARYYRARREWHKALAAASRSAQLYPLPQALGYEADAQRALGMTTEAAITDATILTVERLGNIYGINDRLLANYYAQHAIHLPDALRTAEADYKTRGDEIYADDTLAWALAANGKWQAAYKYGELAARYNTQDPVLEFHTAVVALHTGHREEAERRLKMALALNPKFHPTYADEARRLVALLGDPKAAAAQILAAATTKIQIGPHAHGSASSGSPVSSKIRSWSASTSVARSSTTTVSANDDVTMPKENGEAAGGWITRSSCGSPST